MSFIFNCILNRVEILLSFLRFNIKQERGCGSDGKASVYNVRDLGSIPGLEDSLEKEMATHSSTLALKIPWTEELGAVYYPWGHKESGTTE